MPNRIFHSRETIVIFNFILILIINTFILKSVHLIVAPVLHLQRPPIHIQGLF